MNGMMQTIASFLHQDYALSLFGLLFATGLLLFVRMFVPPDERAQMRIASIYLVLAFVVGLALLIIPGESQIARTFEFFWWFFVLASIGRSLVILFIDVIFARRTHQTKTSPRIFRESRSITPRSAPTSGARSVLLMTSRSDCVMPGPPFRGILSPPETSMT